MKQKKIDQIGELLKIMSTHNTLRSNAIAEKLGINTTDLECLEVLMRLGKTTAGTLSKETRLTTGAVTKLVDRLEKAGFAERMFDKADRRKVFIVLNMDNIAEKVFPLYQSISAEVEKLLLKYTSEQLTVISDFLSESIRLSSEDLSKLADN